MSQISTRKTGLKEFLARRVYIVFVSRERDVTTLRKGSSRNWTVPSSARPGDLVIVYKPGEGAGWEGRREAPFEAFVAAGIVYGTPHSVGDRLYNVPIGEVQMFPEPVTRSQVTDAFPEWNWLRHMRGTLGAEVPAAIEGDFLSLIDRLAYGHPKRQLSPKAKARTQAAG